MEQENRTENLEALISKISFEIVNEKILDENEINKLLGVLSSNGVYAMWVYALDKLGVKFYDSVDKLKEEKIFKLLGKVADLDKYLIKSLDYEQLLNEIAHLTGEIKQLKDDLKQAQRNEEQEMLKNIKAKEKDRNEKLTKYFINIANDIHKLLFLKQLLEKTLIYARYHAKALDGE